MSDVPRNARTESAQSAVRTEHTHAPRQKYLDRSSSPTYATLTYVRRLGLCACVCFVRAYKRNRLNEIKRFKFSRFAEVRHTKLRPADSVRTCAGNQRYHFDRFGKIEVYIKLVNLISIHSTSSN